MPLRNIFLYVNLPLLGFYISIYIVFYLERSGSRYTCMWWCNCVSVRVYALKDLIWHFIIKTSKFVNKTEVYLSHCIRTKIMMSSSGRSNYGVESCNHTRDISEQTRRCCSHSERIFLQQITAVNISLLGGIEKRR